MRGVSASVQFGEKPTPRKPMPSGEPAARHWRRCSCVSAPTSCTVRSGSPDSSNWPPGSSETVPPASPSGRLRAMMLSPSMIGSQPNWEIRPSISARTPRGPAYGTGFRVSMWKRNFSCSVPMRHALGRLGAGGDPGDQVVTRADGRAGRAVLAGGHWLSCSWSSELADRAWARLRSGCPLLGKSRAGHKPCRTKPVSASRRAPRSQEREPPRPPYRPAGCADRVRCV